MSFFFFKDPWPSVSSSVGITIYLPHHSSGNEWSGIWMCKSFQQLPAHFQSPVMTVPIMMVSGEAGVFLHIGVRGVCARICISVRNQGTTDSGWMHIPSLATNPPSSRHSCSLLLRPGRWHGYWFLFFVTVTKLLHLLTHSVFYHIQ